MNGLAPSLPAVLGHALGERANRVLKAWPSARMVTSLTPCCNVSSTNPPFTAAFAGAVNKVAKVMDLDSHTLAALGGLSPEKWEALAVGPKLVAGYTALVPEPRTAALMLMGLLALDYGARRR